MLIFLINANLCIAVTTADWQDYLKQKIKNEQEAIAKQDKKNVYLYYEIYDAFCRKYGYKYSKGEHTSTIPAKVELIRKGSGLDSQYEYENFYNKYSDYINNKKAPTYEFIEAKRNLEKENIEVEIIPEHTETSYYTYLDVNASKAVKAKEVNQVYLAKKDKVDPQPYSVVSTVAKYKVLKKEDVKMILEHLRDRLNTTSISIGPTSWEGSSVSTVMPEREIDDIYFIYEHQPEKFRSYAPELDKKYSQYYPM